MRYFSGTATYPHRLRGAGGIDRRGPSHDLDLGKVREIAEAKLNGKDLGVLWKPPFRIDVTGTLREGENALEVRVTNLWPNRLVGDELLPEDSDRNPDGTLAVLPAAPSPVRSGRHALPRREALC